MKTYQRDFWDKIRATSIAVNVEDRIVHDRIIHGEGFQMKNRAIGREAAIKTSVEVSGVEREDSYALRKPEPSMPKLG